MKQNSLFKEEENSALIKHDKELIEEFGIMMDSLEELPKDTAYKPLKVGEVRSSMTHNIDGTEIKK